MEYGYEKKGEYCKTIHIKNSDIEIIMCTDVKNETMDYLIENGYELLQKIKDGNKDG